MNLQRDICFAPMAWKAYRKAFDKAAALDLASGPILPRKGTGGAPTHNLWKFVDHVKDGC